MRLFVFISLALFCAVARPEDAKTIPICSGLLAVERDQLLGNSAPIFGVKEEITLAAPTNISILITGESGTGKEVAARMIHRLSKRSRKPFIARNCAGFSPALLESELFGHEKGAFTGATSAREGIFELAKGGTIFLDEIGEMPKGLQSKLLRVLESREITRVGGTRTHPIDFRILSATNRDPLEAIKKGKLRQDLYYRLARITIEMPALRDRGEDIPLLVERFRREVIAENGFTHREFAPETMDLLTAFPWPGNVRQLRNIVEASLVYANNSDLVLPDHLPRQFHEMMAGEAESFPTLEEITYLHVSRALSLTSGRRDAAANLLGISLQQLDALYQEPNRRSTN